MSTAVGETQVATNHRATFMELYDRVAPTVLRYCRFAAGDQDAEDVCADVFCSAWPAWPRFRGDEAKARAWVMRIARNKVIDRGRARRRVSVVSLESGPEVVAPASDAAERMQLRAALEHLSEGDRELLLLRAAGLTHAEIGAVQGRSEAAVKVAWSRALQRLKPHLEVIR